MRLNRSIFNVCLARMAGLVIFSSTCIAQQVNRVQAANMYGVLASGDNTSRPEIVNVVTDLGCGWVRLNLRLDGSDQNFKLFLDAGVHVILNLSNRDRFNMDTTYGTYKDFPNAGFPYRSKSEYQQRITDLLIPVLPYLTTGRELWVQCENEIGDASVNPDARYWRGTLDQYLIQLDALFEAVRSTSSSIPIVLSSFASGTLDALVDTNDPRHAYAVSHVTKLMNQGKYDAVDLHFYGCVEDIPQKIQWIKTNMPQAKRWISTENGGPDYRCPTTKDSWQKDSVAYETNQAKQVPARLKSCADNGGSICLWFSLFDLRNESDVFAHMGLVDQAANPPRKKSAYFAFKNFVASSTGVKENSVDDFHLYQNYPNPFSESTTISFDTQLTIRQDGNLQPKSHVPNLTAHISLKVFDLLGREVATLVDGIFDAGQHSIEWDTTELKSGMYFYQLTSGQLTQTQKAILMR